MSKTTPRQIVDARAKINQIDAGILDLLKKRMRLASEIGQAKAQHGLDTLDESREQELLAELIKINDGEIPDEKLLQIWGKIIELSRQVQEK